MTGHEGEPTYRIRQVAEQTHLPESTIRFYEKQFAFYLKTPRTAGGHRRYSKESIRRLLYLKYLLHTKNLSVKDVTQRLLREEDPRAVRREIETLHQAIEQLTRQVHLLQQAMEQLAERITILEDQRQRKARNKRFFRTDSERP